MTTSSAVTRQLNNTRMGDVASVFRAFRFCASRRLVQVFSEPARAAPPRRVRQLADALTETSPLPLVLPERWLVVELA
jgi:hypothetical protein